MKKLILLLPILVVALLSLSGCGKEFEDSFGESVYYTKIDSTPSPKKDSENKSYYLYHQKLVNDKGEVITLDMQEYREKPLKLNSYLKTKVNKKDGVKSWEEISRNSVPKIALEVVDK